MRRARNDDTLSSISAGEWLESKIGLWMLWINHLWCTLATPTFPPARDIWRQSFDDGRSPIDAGPSCFWHWIRLAQACLHLLPRPLFSGIEVALSFYLNRKVENIKKNHLFFFNANAMINFYVQLECFYLWIGLDTSCTRWTSRVFSSSWRDKARVGTAAVAAAGLESPLDASSEETLSSLVLIHGKLGRVQ